MNIVSAINIICIVCTFVAETKFPHDNVISYVHLLESFYLHLFSVKNEKNILVNNGNILPCPTLAENKKFCI